MLKKKAQVMRRDVKLGSRGLYQEFDFVFHLHLTLLILGQANTLSLSLQRKDEDIL
jgi:hypothetical protein